MTDFLVFLEWMSNGAAAGDLVVLPVFLLFWALVFGTFITEDLTCVIGGLLVALGHVPYWVAVAGCSLGIFIGDVGLYLLGRVLGRPLLKIPPFKWLISAESLRQKEKWFASKGVKVIFASRFLPGTRLATYVAAGVLRVPLRLFVGYFLLAVLAWTPLLVGLSIFFGREMVEFIHAYESYALVSVIGFFVGMWVVRKVIVSACTFKGRRLFVGWVRRWVRWEFWPMWFFYPPMVLYILWLGIRYRGFLWFMSVNPGMYASGLVGESKLEILEALGEGSHVAPFERLSISKSLDDRRQQVAQFMARMGDVFPVVIKPDQGQRGEGVVIVQDAQQLDEVLVAQECECVLQSFIPGDEFSVFYCRYPGDNNGFIYSITEKRIPFLVGDGSSTVEELILMDDRAVVQAHLHLATHENRLQDVLGDGERLQLVSVGAHCRGTIFLDGGSYKTDVLEREVDRLLKRYDGFYFGRLDVKSDDVASFKRGEFKILELNGVTSESTNMYDPRYSVFDAYRIMRGYWRIAFEIGRENVRSGRASRVSLVSFFRFLF